MIVPMKKVTLLCLDADVEGTLDRLRDLGAVHLAPTREPAGRDLDELRARLQQSTAALRVLDALLAEKGAKRSPSPGGARGSTAGATSAPSMPALTSLSGADALAETQRLAALRKECRERIERLEAEESAAEPFGEFDPAVVRALAGKGIAVRLYLTSPRGIVRAPEGAVAVVTRQDAAGRYVAVVGRGDFLFEGRQVPLPARSLSAIRAERAAANATLDETDARLREMSDRRGSVAEAVVAIEDSRRLAEARAGMGEAPRIAYLRGFCPSEATDTLRKEAAAQGWGLVVDDPDPSDRVPTLIRNPAWLRPIESLFRMISILPGYREVDVSVSFLLFLSLFFAMIVGDAGYGLLFLAGTLGARRRMRSAPAEPFRLMTIFSVSTIVWGILTGTYFAAARIPAPLAKLRVEWLADNNNIMSLCLLIGAVHLTVAHVWNVIRMFNSLQAVAQAGWVAMTWAIYFAAKKLLLNAALPACFWPLLVLGLLYVVLFMTPRSKMKEEWVNHALLPLTIMSNFGDVLSYLRLFALGVAGVQLAGAFNAMAASLGFSRPLAGLVAALILFVGHAMNVALSFISVLVHGIRLNALEFSMHFGLEWAGFPYAPFARRGPPRRPPA